MAITDATAVGRAMANYYRMHPDKAQFTRSQQTLRFFKPPKMAMKGEENYYFVFVQPMSAARGMGDAVTAEKLELPAPRQIDHKKVKILWSDLYQFGGSLEYTDLSEAKTKDRKMAIYRVARKLMGTVDADIGTLVNAALHQNADLTMATIEAIYDEDTTGYTGGQVNAYVKITGGSIMQFAVGQRIDFRNAADGTDIRLCAYINDIYATSTGPTGTAAYGPGFTCTIDATENAVERFGAAGTAVGDANMDAVAIGDEIVMSEHADSTNFQSLAAWFSHTTDVFDITRAAVGSAWSIPHIRAWGGVTLDLETHLGTMAEELAYAVNFGRQQRLDEGMVITSAAMVLLGTPRLISEASRQVGDQVQYTSAIDGDTKKKLFGTSGFDGAFWHNPILKAPISFVSDPVATPGYARLLEPSSWQFVIGHEGASPTAVQWLDKAGLWHQKMGSNGRLTPQLVAGWLTRVALMNDQPKTNYEHQGLKSSLEA